MLLLNKTVRKIVKPVTAPRIEKEIFIILFSTLNLLQKVFLLSHKDIPESCSQLHADLILLQEPVRLLISVLHLLTFFSLR